MSLSKAARRQKEKWFYDKIKGVCCGLKIDNTLYRKKSKFQAIQILESKNWGRILTLDKTIQTTERDEFIYHEIISHVPLFLHPRPEDVLIIGGGDGGVLREVLRHKTVKNATLVEIDKYVIEASKKYLKEIHQNSFYNARAKIIIGDGVEFVKKHMNCFDVIIIDSTDPVGAAKDLFSGDFYQGIASALKKNGIFVTQSGAIFGHWGEFLQTFKNLKRSFPLVAPYIAPVPTYPSSLWSFIIASKAKKMNTTPMGKIKRSYSKVERLKYYSPEIHRASFTLPKFIKEGLKK